MILRNSLLTLFGFIMMMALMFVGVQFASATDYYWVGGDATWGTNANWNTTEAACSGAGDGGEPGPGDNAIFTSSCVADVTVTAAANWTNLEAQAGYTGTITLAGAANIDGNVTIVSGSTFDAGGNALTVAGNWTNGGIFVDASSTVTFDGASGTQTIITGGTTGNFDFNDVVIASTGDDVILDTNGMTVNGTFTINSGSVFRMLGQNLTVTGTYANNEGTLKMYGNETITLTAGMDVDSGTTYFEEGTASSRNLNGLTTFNDLFFNDNGFGATWTMAANIDVNGDFRIAGGTFVTGGFDINVAGQWRNDDIFTHGDGLVTLDGTAQSIVGDTTFYDLTKSVASADTLSLTAASTTTVSNTLTLNGAYGNVLTLASLTPATAANLDTNGTATVSYLSVSDMTNAGSTLIQCLSGCTNGGGNTGWYFPNVTGGTSSTLVSDSVSTTALLSPNGGESVMGGSQVNIGWTASGDDLSTVSLWYSVDNGQTYTLVASEEENDGVYTWTVPNMTVANAKIRVVGMTSGGLALLSDDSNQSFTVTMDQTIAEEVVETPEETPVETEPSDAISMVDANGNMVSIGEGSLFRGVELSGVYLVRNSTRYVFPDEATFFSHGYSFDDVVMVADDQLRLLAIGGRMRMASGTMIKIQSSNYVYQVQEDGFIAHIPDERTAAALYGPAWNTLIKDVSPIFWPDYTVGEALPSQQ